MNPTPEPFESLQRLLALKRHEVPPPGYFTHFSDRVITRLETEEHVVPAGWWQHLASRLAFRPLVALGYAAGVLGLFAVGATASRYLEADQNASMALSSPWLAAHALPAPEETPAAPGRVALNPVDASSSVNPVLAASPAHALFDVNRLTAQRASYIAR